MHPLTGVPFPTLVVGCAKARRLLALKARASFPSIPQIGHDHEAAVRAATDISVNARLRPPTFTPQNLPLCRQDRPDLYSARQCNGRDCFCVNVTTGLVFPATRTDREDLGDCGTGSRSHGFNYT